MLHIPPLLELFQGLIVALFPKLNLPGVTRVSLGIENDAEEVDTLIHMLDQIARQPRPKVSNPFASTQTDIQKQMDASARTVAQRVYGELKF
jgi:hypothetical protein